MTELLVSLVHIVHCSFRIFAMNIYHQTNLLAYIQWLNLGLSIGNRTVFCGFLIKWAIAQFRHTCEVGRIFDIKNFKTRWKICTPTIWYFIISAFPLLLVIDTLVRFNHHPILVLLNAFLDVKHVFVTFTKPPWKDFNWNRLSLWCCVVWMPKKKFEESATADKRKRRWKTCQIRSSV